MKKPISVVTGATGLVGSHLVDYLLKMGHSVRCITRKSSDLKWLVNKDVEIFDCGLFDVNKLEPVLSGADFLFHVAGVVKSKKPEGYFNGNVEPTKNILNAVLKFNPAIKRVVVVASLAAYGPSNDGTPVKADAEMKPITTYGRSKFEQVKIVEEFSDRIPLTVCAPPAVYGERDTDVYLIFKTFKSRIMTLIGSDKKLISIIHVRDLVRGIYLASQSEKTIGQKYFITSKEIIDWYRFAEVAKQVFGKSALLVKVPHWVVFGLAALSEFFARFKKSATIFNIEKARDITQKYWVCDYKKAEEDFGFIQEISLEEGIKSTVDWYKENNWL